MRCRVERTQWLGLCFHIALRGINWRTGGWWSLSADGGRERDEEGGRKVRGKQEKRREDGRECRREAKGEGSTYPMDPVFTLLRTVTDEVQGSQPNISLGHLSIT